MLTATSFGNRIESIVTCSACQKPFEINFLLSALLAEPEVSPAQHAPDGDNIRVARSYLQANPLGY